MALKKAAFEDLFKSSYFYDLDKYCDAVVIAEDGVEFKAHRLFLSKGSYYFLAFFRSNTGKNMDIVSLKFHSDLLENILIFLYTGEVVIDDTNITDLIIAADYLLIDPLLMHCRNFTLRHISLHCCISLLVVSHFVDRLRIAEHCFRFVLVHFEKLVHKCDSDIAELPLHSLKDLLNDDSLGVLDEETVWRAIIAWVEDDFKDRQKNVPELVSCIRWSSVNSSLASCISNHRIFKNNEFCRNLSLGELPSKHKTPGSGQLMSTTGIRCPSKMYVFACSKYSPYSDDRLEVEMFLTYDGQLDIWRKIGEADNNFDALIAMGGIVFMFNTVSNKMRAFDLITKGWQDKSCVPTFRQCYCVVQSQNFIFVAGGFDSLSNIQMLQVEYYDPIDDVWSYTSPLPFMNVCGSSVVNDKLYIIGYVEDSEVVEMKAIVYDQVQDAWSNIEKPKQFRTNFAMVNFQERLYIFGGRTEDFTVTTLVEVYDTEEGEWKEFPPLPFPYEQPEAVVLNDRLVVYDFSPGILPIPRLSPCTFNDAAHFWEVEDVNSPFNEIHRYQFCCIDDTRVLQELAKENKNSEIVWARTLFATI